MVEILKGEDLPFKLCAILLAPIALYRGFIDAGGGSDGILWGLAMILGFQVFCNLPAAFVFIFISAYLDHLDYNIFVNSAYILVAIFFAINAPIDFHGGGCTGMEIEDRWGQVRCIEANN